MQEFYTLTLFISIATFTLSTVLSPGPNNIMLLSSGLTFGYKKTVPHMMGIIVGFPLMVLVVGLGLGIIFEKYAFIFIVLKYFGITYLFYMAYKIATNVTSFEFENSKCKQPFTFLQSVLFQWVNPKAWVMAITSISIFVTSEEDNLIQVCIIALIYFLSGLISTNVWTYGGVILQKLITNKQTIRKVNIIMALLLVCSVLPFLIE